MFQTLIVDDERIEREGLKKLIQRFQLPLRVSLATNGQEALEQLRARPADLLLTDVRMPFMDGLELSKRALAEHPHLKVVLVSGFSEFEYARTALQLGISDYLLKPVQVSEFLSTMNKVIAGLRASASQKEEQLLRDQYMREHTLMMLVNGMPLESLRQRFQKAEDTLFLDSYRSVFMLEFENLCFGKSDAGERLVAYLEREIGLPFDFIYLGDSSGMILFRGAPASGGFAAIAERLYGWMASVFGYVFCIAVSGSISRAEELVRAFGQLEALLENRFFSQSRILYANKQTDFGSLPTKLEEELLEQLQTMVAGRCFSQAKECLNRLRDAFPSHILFSHIYVKSVFSKILAEILKDLPDVSAQRSYQLVTKIYKAGAISELADLILPLLEALESREDLSAGNGSRISELVKQYVYAHYKEDISLKSVASAVFLSPQYLSSVFKKETGGGLAKFIKDYRMKKAQELLRKTNQKIHVICTEVGYSNESYFCKSFRECFGVSPEKYRLQGAEKTEGGEGE